VKDFSDKEIDESISTHNIKIRDNVTFDPYVSQLVNYDPPTPHPRLVLSYVRPLCFPPCDFPFPLHIFH